MPMWYHTKCKAKQPRTLYNRGRSGCIKNNHGAVTVGDVEDLARLKGTNRHQARAACRCPNCMRIRQETRCDNPHACYLRAELLLNSLPHKWNPLQRQPPEPTRRQNTRHTEGETDNDQPDSDSDSDDDDEKTFEPNIVTTGTLGDVFRIFTAEESEHNTPELTRPHGRTTTQEYTIHISVTCRNENGVNPSAGAGIHVVEDPTRNCAICIPDELEPNQNSAQFTAVLKAVELIPLEANIKILTSSRSVAHGLTKKMKKWEDEDYLDVANCEIIKAVIAKLRKRTGKTSFILVETKSKDDQPPAYELTKTSKELAEQGIQKPKTDMVDTTIAPETRLTGMKLQAITQSSTYKMIRRLKMEKPEEQDKLDRKITRKNMNEVKNRIIEVNGPDNVPPEANIWRGLRSKDFSRPIRHFMWMSFHGGYKIGGYWSKINGYEARGHCEKCNKEESMKHILTECQNHGQKEVWTMANEIWKKKTGDELQVSFADILGCGAVKSRGRTQDRGDMRLYRILVSESAHLIWRLRNERVIREREITDIEIRNRWTHAMNLRLKLDYLSTSPRYGRSRTCPKLVAATWNVSSDEETDRQIDGENNLSNEGLNISTGVLAGIGRS